MSGYTSPDLVIVKPLFLLFDHTDADRPFTYRRHRLNDRITKNKFLYLLIQYCIKLLALSTKGLCLGWR